MPERTMNRADWCFWWRYMRRNRSFAGAPSTWRIVVPNPLGVERAYAAGRLKRAALARAAGQVFTAHCILEPGV